MTNSLLNKLIYCLTTHTHKKCGVSYFFPSQRYLASLPITTKYPDCSGSKQSERVRVTIEYPVSVLHDLLPAQSTVILLCLIEWLSKVKTDGLAVNNCLIGRQGRGTAPCLPSSLTLPGDRQLIHISICGFKLIDQGKSCNLIMNKDKGGCKIGEENGCPLALSAPHPAGL